MALTPEGLDIPEITAVDAAAIPLRTYEFDFVNGRMTGRIIDGVDAVMQAAIKALLTPRFKHIIYSDQYGNEQWALIGQDATQELAQTENERYVTECLLSVPYVDAVTSLVVTKDDDKVFVTGKLQISSIAEAVTLEVTV